MAGIDGIVGAHEQLVDVAGKVHGAAVFADGGQIGGGLPVEEAEFLQVGTGERLQAAAGALVEQRLRACSSAVCVSPASEWKSLWTRFDQLKIDTPEQIALELPLAGIGSRFLAIAIDTLIQVALYIIAGLFSS